MRYLRCTYAAPEELRELLVAALWDAGTLGVEEGVEESMEEGGSGGAEVVAWFGAAVPGLELPPGATRLAEEWVEGEDWLAGYRAAAQPIPVGERLWVDPREPDAPPVAPPAGRLALRIPARTAFGTGSHASTSLAVRLLERLPLEGVVLLDVGTGSGILSLAALALGARRAAGFDLDLAAALLAGQHARLNGIRGAAFWAGGIESLAAGARFDVVVANALPHELLPVAAAVAGVVAARGRLIVSGALAVEREPVLAGWRTLGLAPVDALEQEEWAAWTLARAGGAA